MTKPTSWHVFTAGMKKATMYVTDADITFCFNSMRIVSLYMYM